MAGKSLLGVNGYERFGRKVIDTSFWTRNAAIYLFLLAWSDHEPDAVLGSQKGSAG